MKLIHKIALAGLLSASVSVTMAGSEQWIGLGASQNWSDAGNYGNFGNPPGTVPIFSDDLYLEDLLFTSGYTNAAKVVNNVVDVNTTVGSINYTASSAGTTNHFYTTLIPSGVTLTVGGAGFNSTAVAVGDIPGSGSWVNSGVYTNYSTITGPGTLSVNNPATLISVGWRNRATLDLAGLNTFNANVNQLRVGVTTDNPGTSSPIGWLMLAGTNNIATPANLTAPGVLLGYAMNVSASGGGVIQLGLINNFNTDGLVVGGRHSSAASLSFGPAYFNGVTPGTFTLRGSAGGTTPISTFSIGDDSANWDGYDTPSLGTSGSASATADFSGGTVDILADSIFIGRAASAGNTSLANQTGSGTGTLIAEHGTITATNLYIGYKPASTNDTGGSGTLTLRSNAVMNVLKDFSFVYRTNGIANLSGSILNVNDNAALNIGGNLLSTNIGSWTPAAINLGGGAINMTNGGLVYVPVISGSGTITNAANVTVTNALMMGTDTTIGTLNVGNNLTLGSAVILTFNLGPSTTIGGGVNDYLNVPGNVTFSNNVITLAFSAPLVAGTYTLIGYGGTQSGSVTLNNPSRLPIGLEQGINHRVAIIVTNASPAPLVWQATAGTATWNSTSNFWNGNTDKFYPWDNVVFDDTGLATNVTITGVTNLPGSITVSNNTKLYTFTQSSGGRIGGFGSLTKNGTNTLAIGGGGIQNDFTGPVNINGGSVKIASFNTGVLGTAGVTNPINITAGGNLDLNGNTIGAASQYGRPINVAGTGLAGTGAIGTSNAIGGTMFTSQITLTGDTLIGAATNRMLIFNGLFSPYSGVLDLSGYTLTTTGAGEVRITQMMLTNGGTINVGSSALGIRNAVIDGSGPINLGNNTLNFYSGFFLGYVAKAITVTNGTILAGTANAGTIPLMSPISIANGGSLTINNLEAIASSGVISGNGSLIKSGTSNLVVSVADTYTGSTTVSNGTLTLTGAGSLASPLITINSGAGFDVTGLAGGLTLLNQTLTMNGAAAGNLALVGAGSTLSGSGSIAGSVSVGSGATLAPGSSVTSGTLAISGNLSLANATAIIKLASSTTPGGASDLVTVGGNFNLTAPTTIQIVPVGGLSGTYTLIQYAGSLVGNASNLTVVSDTRYSLALDTTSTPGSILVVVSGGGNLTWKGGAASAPTAWNIHTTTNWLSGATPDVFYQGDFVTFDDTASTNLVNLTNSVGPTAVTMNNSSLYTFTGAGSLLAGGMTLNGAGGVTMLNSGSNAFTGTGLALNAGTLTFNQPSNTILAGKLTGNANIVKSGTNILTVSSADSTGFYGPVAANAGTLRQASSNAFGHSAITIAPAATFDLNGQPANLGSIQASGVGVGGLGAINNSGAIQSNAFTHITLNGDTTLGAANNRWDVTPVDTFGTPGSFVGNGYKLTKTGTSDIWLRQLTDVGLGAIDISAGRLVFSGAGTTLGLTLSNLVVRTNAILGFANGVQAGGANATVSVAGSLYSAGTNNHFDASMVLSNGLVNLDANASLTLGGNLSGPAMLQVRSTALGVTIGTLRLTGSNSYTGGTLVNEGLLMFAGSNSIPTNGNVTLFSRSLNSSGSQPSVELDNNIVSPTNVTLAMQTLGSAGAALASLNGDGGTWAGPVVITGNTNCIVSFSATTNGLFVTGPINATGFTNGGSLLLHGNGCDTVTLQGAGVQFKTPLTFGGLFEQTDSGGSFGTPQMAKVFFGASGNSWTSMLFYRGLIQIGANNALPLAPIVVGQPSGGDARFILDLNGYNQTIANLRDSGLPVNTAIWIGNSSTNANSVLTYAGTGGTNTSTWPAFIVDALDTNAPVQHTTSLAVTAGRLQLVNQGVWTDLANFTNYPPSGPLANTYSGPTTVTGGTLEVDGVSIGSSPVTVGGTGTLAGTNGIFLGPVIIAAGGTLAPGTTNLTNLGTMFINNNLTLGGKSVFKFNLALNANDQVVGVNNLVYGGTIVISNVGVQAITSSTILPLFSAAHYTAGTVNILPASPGNGLHWDTSYLAVDGTLRVISVNTTPVSMTSVVSGGTMTLSWPGDHTGWRLQTQTNSLNVGLSSVWFDVPGSTGTNSVTMPIAPGNPTVFFRLVYP